MEQKLNNNNANNQQMQTVHTFHQDMIHDINFNFFGTRMATVSSDKTVKIFNKDSQGQFKLHSEFKVHDGPIWKVKWALPEFGNIIATCSFDRTFAIYEESKNLQMQAGQNNQEKSQVQWIRKHLDKESKESIEDIKFGPRHKDLASRLTIASGCRDGVVRICHTENDMSLNQWQCESKFKVSSLGVSCLSWNKSQLDPLMLAIGSKYNPQYHQDITQVQQTFQTNEQEPKQNYEQLSYFSIYIKGSQRWECLYEDKDQKYIQDSINDISWVAQNGKDYHQIAVCGKFGCKIIKFIYKGMNDYTLEAIDVINDIELWRVSWNILGTLVACTDSNNNVLVFSVQKGGNDWKKVANIQEQQQQQPYDQIQNNKQQ